MLDSWCYFALSSETLKCLFAEGDFEVNRSTTSEIGLLKQGAVTLAIFAFLFATCVAPLHHDNPTSSSACQICHLVNLPLSGPQLSVQLPQPIQFRNKVPAATKSLSRDPVTDHTSPRAPPLS
jgi:hypothetical protein